MPIETPYYFDLDDPKKKDGLKLFRDSLKNVSQFHYKDSDYKYGVIDPAVALHVPGFVGMPGGNNLFVSEEVPSEDLPHSLAHEIECNRLRAGTVGRCKAIEQELLSKVYDPNVRWHLVEARHNLYMGLSNHYKIDFKNPPSENGLPKEIFGTQQFLSNEFIKVQGYTAFAEKLGVPREKLMDTLHDLLKPEGGDEQRVDNAIAELLGDPTSQTVARSLRLSVNFRYGK